MGNGQMAMLSAKIDEFCNLFIEDALTSMVYVATGQAASKTAKSFAEMESG